MLTNKQNYLHNECETDWQMNSSKLDYVQGLTDTSYMWLKRYSKSVPVPFVTLLLSNIFVDGQCIASNTAQENNNKQSHVADCVENYKKLNWIILLPTSYGLGINRNVKDFKILFCTPPHPKL